MPLKILTVDDEPAMIKFYQDILRDHDVTPVDFVHEVWAFVHKPFDVAFLDFNIDESGSIDGLLLAKELKKTNPSITTVLVTGEQVDRDFALESDIDIYVEKGGSATSKILEVVQALTTGRFQLDFWDSITHKGIEPIAAESKLRRIASHSEREYDFTTALHSQINAMRHEYTPERHAAVYASLAFARIAGYELKAETAVLYELYRKVISDIARWYDKSILPIPDLSKVIPKESREYLMHNQGSALLRYADRLKKTVINELSESMKKIHGKHSNLHIADRAMTFACLALLWVTGNAEFQYHAQDPFEVYDDIMVRHGKNAEFYKHKRP
ncbi:response regulator [Nanoarchaeota archaeon]